MSPFRRLSIGVLAALVSVPSAFALPVGWAVGPAPGNVQTYRHSSGAMSSELRVFPPEAGGATLQAWFAGRSTARMPGIAQSRFEPASEFRPGMVMMTGEGIDDQGRQVALMRLGCQRPEGPVVYAESSLSSDRAYIKDAVNGLVTIFMTACVGSADGHVAARTGSVSSATVAKPAEKRAPAAEPPYAYVKAAGTGLKPRDIEAILWEWRNEQSGMTMQVRTYYYLLLKDGTYRDGLPPVALEDFDAAAAKRGEKEWGRWTRSGANYGLQLNGSSEVNKVAADSARSPARKDEKLDGTWEIETAYSSLWSVSRSRRAISFDRDGRFSRNSGGSVVGSMGSQAAGNAVGGSVVHDDDSSSSSMGSQVAVAGTTRRRPSTLPDRSGTYRLDGYTLELRYDSGRVERLSFCATGDRDNIYFQGEELRREKPGKR